MSKSKSYFYKKGVNCNKPFKSAREQNSNANLFGEKSNRRGESFPSKQERPDKPPPGLKGKEIGLWYRDRQRSKDEKPLSIVLNASKLDEIEEVLYKVGTLKEDVKFHKDFQQRFLEKINVTFEEKLNQSDIVKFKSDPELDEELYEEINKKKGHSKHFQKMLDFRQRLPSFKKRKELVDLIENNQMIVISGETGNEFFFFKNNLKIFLFLKIK